MVENKVLEVLDECLGIAGSLGELQQVSETKFDDAVSIIVKSLKRLETKSLKASVRQKIKVAVNALQAEPIDSRVVVSLLRQALEEAKKK